MKEHYEKYGQNVPDSTTPDASNQEGSEVEEGNGEDVTVDLTESDSDDYDAQSEEETEEDRMFIDDENETEDNFRNTRPPSSASSASTSTVSSYTSNNDYFTSRPSCSSSNGVPGTSASAFANASTSTSTFPSTLSSSEYHNRSYLNLMDLSEQYDDISDEELISLWS